MDQLVLCCCYSLVNANTVPVVPLITAIAPNHPILLVVRLCWIILVLTDWTDLKEKGWCFWKISFGVDLVTFKLSHLWIFLRAGGVIHY